MSMKSWACVFIMVFIDLNFYILTDDSSLLSRSFSHEDNMEEYACLALKK